MERLQLFMLWSLSECRIELCKYRIVVIGTISDDSEASSILSGCIQRVLYLMTSWKLSLPLELLP